MSAALSIRAALETALNGITPALATAWENAAFSPPNASTPYQQVTILFAEPANPSMGDAFRREQGYMQASLFYPLHAGSKNAITRAELLRTTFYRGATFVSGGVTTIIERTPEITPGYADGDRWRVNVKIRFFANIAP